MTPLGIGRLVLLSLISILSGADAGLSGYLLSLVVQIERSDQGFEFLGFSLACGVITILIIMVVRILDWTMADSWASKTAVELGWLGVLMIFWMASAGYTTSLIAPLQLGSCSSYYSSADQTVCSEAQALEALGWVIWLCLLTLFVWTLTFAIIAHNRGYKGVWMAHASRHRMAGKGGVDLAGGMGGRYASVGTQDYGMEQMKAYADAPLPPQMGYHAPAHQQPHPQQQGQQGQQAGMYGQPQWGQPYTNYNYGSNVSYNPAPPQQQQQQPARSPFGQPRNAPPQQQQPQAAYVRGPPPGAAPAVNPYAPGVGYQGRAEV